MNTALGATEVGVDTVHFVASEPPATPHWNWEQINSGLAQVGHAASRNELHERLAPVLARISPRAVLLGTPAANADRSGEMLPLYWEEGTPPETVKSILADEKGSATRSIVLELPGLREERLIALFDGEDPVPPKTRTILHAVAAHVAVWQVRHKAGIQETASLQLAALTELLARAQTSPTATEACQIMADELHDYLGCQQVILGQCPKGAAACRVVAVSHVDAFHSNSEEIRVAQAALLEVIARGETSIWPARDDRGRFGLKALERYARSHSWEFAIGAPLQDDRGDVHGAWLFAGPATQSVDHVLSMVRASQTPVASTLRLLQRARMGPVRRIFKGLGQWMRRRRGLAFIGLVLACVALMFVPVPRRVTCDCQLEPVTRRFVAAPFAAPLERTFVEPGDLVAQGELLARLDGREVRWELAGVQADLFRAAKQRAGHVASHEAGEAEMARHDVDRLQYRQQLLQARDQDLEIRSPVAGMVVSGDLKEEVGVPLHVGQVLFEVAPLDAMDVELAIPEDDLPEVQAGMPVRIRLDAFPLRVQEAGIDRIHPRAELVEDQNVFIAEVRLENPRHTLRPGMRGHARISAGTAPIGWILFRRPWFAVLQWLGW